MDISLQIQGIKTQLDNMKLQVDNIEILYNNPMMKNTIGDQLLNLSIQILNIGIQIFKTGKIFSFISNKFFEKLQEISNQINYIINSHNMDKMQQQTMQQQMMQQQMMKQQMMQQQMMQQQMMQQQMMQLQNNDYFRINVSFKGNFQSFVLAVKPNMTIKELCDKFKKEITIKYNSLEYKQFFLLYHTSIIDINCLKTVQDYFGLGPLNYSANYLIEIEVIFR